MPHPERMAPDPAGLVPVIDFRRHSMILHWHVLGGTWTACEIPPALVHGVALIRAAPPNVCLYGYGGRLLLQVGPDQYALTENSPRIRCGSGFATFGLRRRFSVESTTGGVLFSQSYWTSQGEDFFRWLADRCQDPDWRATVGRRWSEGVSAAELRAT
jgi:hypothetical protein